MSTGQEEGEPYVPFVARRGRRPAKGPTKAQKLVLNAVRVIGGQGGQASAIAVADKLGVSRQVVTRHLLELERKGLIADIPKVMRSGFWRVT